MSAASMPFATWCCLLAAVAAMPGAPSVIAAPAHGINAAQPPFMLVRALKASQDRIAQGSIEAYDAQRRLIPAIARAFAEADPRLWKKKKNARALLVYVLSGGEPGILRSLLGRGIEIGIDEKLLKGAAAYRAGQFAQAAEYFDNVDPRQLDASMAGHIALVKSVLIARRDAVRAARLLDFARLVAPGTLIEESALRRQMYLSAKAGNHKLMEDLASRYLRRFAKSVYAKGFLRQLLAAVTDKKYPESAQRHRALAAILSHLEPDKRRDAFLSIAGGAVIGGRLRMARFAAKKAGELTRHGSGGQLRASVYEAAALVVTDELDRGLAMLEGIDRGKLSPPDIDLLEAALSLAGEVRRLPGEPSGAPAKATPFAQKARDLIAQTDQLLSEPAR